MKIKSNHNLSIILVYIVAFTGVLYGYNIGATAGLIIFLKHHFQITTTETSLLVSSFLMGVFVMLLIMPNIHKLWSRKRILITAIVVSMMGTVIMVLSHDINFIIAARFLMGISSGMITATAPLYIVETIPCTQRGRATVTFQLSLCFGILVSSLITYFLSSSHNWVILVLFELPFSIFLFVALNIVHKSPRWLMNEGKNKECISVLLSTHTLSETKKLYRILKQAKNISHKGYLTFPLLKKYFRPILLTFLLCSLNQLVGINVILQYDSNILLSVGFSQHNLAFLGSVFVTSINFIITLLGFYIADKFERKYILRIGLAGVFLALMSIYVIDLLMTNGHAKAILTTALLSVFIVCFAVAPGSLVWGVAAEILPSTIRAAIQPLALSLGSLCGAILSLTYLYLINTIQLKGVFLLFSAFSALYLVLTFFLPKTNNMILEDIHDNYKNTESL